MGTTKIATASVIYERRRYRLFWPSALATHIAVRFDGDPVRERQPHQPDQNVPYDNPTSHPFLHLSIEHMLNTWQFSESKRKAERRVWEAVWGNHIVVLVVELTRNSLIVVHSAYVKPKHGQGRNYAKK